MKPHYTQYLVATSEGRWGRGDDLKTALKNANALNKSQTKPKRGIEIFAYINIQLEDDRLTQERVDALAKGPFVKVTGYEPGEFMLPWIDDYGSPHHYGILEKIDLCLP
jgi:hypothetical protein